MPRQSPQTGEHNKQFFDMNISWQGRSLKGADAYIEDITFDILQF